MSEPRHITPFTLESDEGLPIRGDLHLPAAPPRALVVVVHGFKGFKDWAFFPWVAQRLASQRIAVCRFNMSRSGIGEDPEAFDRLDLFADDTYSTQLADLRRVVAWAQKQCPDLPTFLLGHSRGGGVAILGAHEVERLHGVIAWSPIAHVDRWDEAALRQWERDGFVEVVNARTRQTMRMSRSVLDDYRRNPERFDITAAAARLSRPLLIVHGGRDESVPHREGQALASAAPLGSIAIIAKAGHTFNAIHPLIHIPAELSLAVEMSTRFVLAWAPRTFEVALPVA